MRGDSLETHGASGLWIAVVAVWICVVVYLTPAMAALWLVAPGWVEKVGLGLFMAMLSLFWFFGVYYVLVAVRGIWHSTVRTEVPQWIKQVPSYAPRGLLLYPTRNDFRREPVEALRRVSGRCEVVICDDSTLDRYTREIDAMVAEVPPTDGLNPVRVVRRPASSGGWKAGNVNHALRQSGLDCDYFAICDADGIFPPDFVEKLLPHLRTADDDEDVPIAFAQARQEGNPAQPDAFGRAMSAAVGAHFRHVVRARDTGGFTMFYGHGALISMKAWQAVGGFPEIVTEDLAFSLKLRAAGWRGVYVDDLVFPATWLKLRRRSEKWIRGTAECLREHLRPFLRSKHVPWWEKLDVLVHGAPTGWRCRCSSSCSCSRRCFPGA